MNIVSIRETPPRVNTMFINFSEIRDVFCSDPVCVELALRDVRRRFCRDVTRFIFRRFGMVLTTPEFIQELRDLDQLYVLTGEPFPEEL